MRDNNKLRYVKAKIIEVKVQKNNFTFGVSIPSVKTIISMRPVY